MNPTSSLLSVGKNISVSEVKDTAQRSVPLVNPPGIGLQRVLSNFGGQQLMLPFNVNEQELVQVEPSMDLFPLVFGLDFRFEVCGSLPPRNAIFMPATPLVALRIADIDKQLVAYEEMRQRRKFQDYPRPPYCPTPAYFQLSNCLDMIPDLDWERSPLVALNIFEIDALLASGAKLPVDRLADNTLHIFVTPGIYYQADQDRHVNIVLRSDKRKGKDPTMKVSFEWSYGTVSLIKGDTMVHAVCLETECFFEPDELSD